jgi:hypothetical protein
MQTTRGPRRGQRASHSRVPSLEAFPTRGRKNNSRCALVALCRAADAPELVRTRFKCRAGLARAVGAHAQERVRELRPVDLGLRAAVGVDAVPEGLDAGGEIVAVDPSWSVGVRGRISERVDEAYCGKMICGTPALK